MEVELLAPEAASRHTLALEIANRLGASVRPFFHLDSEPSRVKGKPVFYHLTQAFEVVDQSGKMLLQCVDDITLQADLDKSIKPKQGWYRMLSDDVRLLRLLCRHTDPSSPIDTSLQGIAELFGVNVDAAKGGVYRVADESGASIAMAAPLPGERERPCELVTAPLNSETFSELCLYLETAEALGFQIPFEGATHYHFDGAFFSQPNRFLSTVRFLHQYRLVLRRMMGTNLNCRRIGDWPHDFLTLIKRDDLLALTWAECQQRVAQTGVTKYCDFNIRHLVFTSPQKNTLEIRMLPATLNSDVHHLMLRCFSAIFSYLYHQNVFEYRPFMEPTLKNAMLMLKELTLSEEEKKALLEPFSKEYKQRP